MVTLIKLMEKHKVSVRQLALELGVHPRSISDWRNNHSPRPDHLAKVEEYFGEKGIVFGGDSTTRIKVSEIAKRPRPRKIIASERTPVIKPTVAVSPLLDTSVKRPPVFSLTASEEHTLTQVIRLIGFDEALRRLVR